MAGPTAAAAYTWTLVRQEREDVLAFLRELNADQWETPSLCAGWRVRDVAVHMLVDAPVDELGVIRVFMKMAGWRFSVHRANAWWVERNADCATSSIVERFEKSLDPGRLSRFVGADNQLRASIIHHQDMRRPLELRRSIPPERLIAVLDVIVTPKGSGNLGSTERSRGLRFRATDVEWTWGDGPEVSGPAEAILMALAGRPAALAELDGDGRALLADRA
jgi:uncharacterized protein (TIGR03083 family)